MQLRALLAVATIPLAGACTPSVPSVSFDAARMDAGPRDGGSTDASRDTSSDAGPPVDANEDVGLDAFNGRDANFDAGDLRAFDAWIGDDAFSDDANRDAGPPPDTSGCHFPDGAFDLCACGTFGADCTSSACPSAQTCVSDVCGHHCVASGAPCAGAADCPGTSTCVGGTCLAGSTGCADSRDCPNGFACESSTCVDRRFPCDFEGSCPFGFQCDANQICVRQSRPCSTIVACGSLSCVDVNGDGTTECNFAGSCSTNADCPAAGDVCAPRPTERFASCGRYGPCHTAADCASGMECRDLWGDGIPECVDAGGCTNTAGCAAHSVCATPLTGGPPSCLTTG